MATRKKIVRKAPAAKPRAPRKAPAGLRLPVSAEERWRMVAEAAYYIAQRRGFAAGDATQDWLAAEAEVEARLKADGRQPAKG